MDSPLVNAQRQAIESVRVRYEHDDVSLDDFKRALDAIVRARDANECHAIVAALPDIPSNALRALEPAGAQPLSRDASSPRQRIVTFLGSTKRLSRWRLAPEAHATACFGELVLDLRQVELAPVTRMRVDAIMSSVKIIVPSTASVTVRSRIYLSDTQALGAGLNGVVASGDAEHQPPSPDGAPRVEIELFAVMANAHVVLSDARQPTITELARAALLAIAGGSDRPVDERLPPPV